MISISNAMVTNAMVTKTFVRGIEFMRVFTTSKGLSSLSNKRGIEVLFAHVCWFFFSGQIGDKMWPLRILIDGMFEKSKMTLFQALIPSGEKLFIFRKSYYQCINVYDGILLLKILWLQSTSTPTTIR